MSNISQAAIVIEFLKLTTMVADLNFCLSEILSGTGFRSGRRAAERGNARIWIFSCRSSPGGWSTYMRYGASESGIKFNRNGISIIAKHNIRS